MAQAIHNHSRFHNLSNEMLADALGHADAALKGAEAECKLLKDEFKLRGLLEVVGENFTVTATEQIAGRLDVKAVKQYPSARVAEFDPSGLYEATMETADFGAPEQIDAARQRFEEAAKQNGYHRVSKKWNAAGRVEAKIARAILRIPSTGRIGDGIRAAAALILDSPDLENGFETRELLWEIAVRDGFTPPADLVRKFRRKGILIAAKSASHEPARHI
jgi:hypothetical protein